MTTTLNHREYFKPLMDIHKREYPIPKQELQVIVEQTMKELGIVAEKLQRERDGLNPQEQRYADSFLFYYETLSRANVSPISIRVDVGHTPDKRIAVAHRYTHDIASETGSGDWVGWQGIVTGKESIPRLESNNLWSYFIFNDFHLSKDEQSLTDYIQHHLIEEHRDEFLKKFRNQDLLRGDTHFGWSQFKQYLNDVDRWHEQGFVLVRPSQEELEMARLKLADRNLLAYVDLQGNEIQLGKTHFEAWEDFKKENPDNIKRLIEICNLPYEQSRTLSGELYQLVDRTFTLLRIKGFSKYPDLTA